MLQVKNLHYRAGQQEILHGISLHVDSEEFVGIIGPNGSGKSTLLKTIYKFLQPSAGEIELNGASLLQMQNRQMAQEMAVVAQENDANFDFLVEEVVQMGRYPRKKRMEAANREDANIVAHALEQVEMIDFAQRSFLSLSGGEKQRVLIARALAQQTEMIVLDEPTNHLDIGAQIKTLRLLKHSGKTILAVLHDLTLAARFCDRLYALYQGLLYAQGTPRQIITPELLWKLYRAKAEVFDRNGRLCIEFL